VEQAIKYSNTYIGIVDKPMRQAIMQFANKGWKKATQLFHTNNENQEANLLASFGLLYSYARLDDTKNALKYADAVLEHTNFEFWPYLEEHNFPRYARRFALHYLAYDAKENQQFTEAHDYLNEAIGIDSPIDDLDDIPLLETKVSVFLAANEMDAAYNQIQKIGLIDIDNTAFIEIVQSEEFVQYMEEHNLEPLKKGVKNETAKEALDRFKKFLKIYFENDMDEINNYNPVFFRKAKLIELESVEQKFDFKFPPSYRDFVLKHGLFKLGRWNDYESCLLDPTEINTLHNELDKQWNSSFVELNEEDLEATKNLICFSYGDESLQAAWYYCFDKRTLNPETGEMNIYTFSQDEWDFTALEMCTNKGFDEHVVKLINEKIEEFLNPIKQNYV